MAGDQARVYEGAQASPLYCTGRLVELNASGPLLRAALGFLALEPREPELRRLHRCLDNWRGIGEIVAGMARQEYNLELRRYNGQGWRATFFPSGFEHSLTADAGCAWAPSPWERCSARHATRSRS